QPPQRLLLSPSSGKPLNVEPRERRDSAIAGHGPSQLDRRDGNVERFGFSRYTNFTGSKRNRFGERLVVGAERHAEIRYATAVQRPVHGVCEHADLQNVWRAGKQLELIGSKTIAGAH